MKDDRHLWPTAWKQAFRAYIVIAVSLSFIVIAGQNRAYGGNGSDQQTTTQIKEKDKKSVAASREAKNAKGANAESDSDRFDVIAPITIAPIPEQPKINLGGALEVGEVRKTPSALSLEPMLKSSKFDAAFSSEDMMRLLDALVSSANSAQAVESGQLGVTLSPENLTPGLDNLINAIYFGDAFETERFDTTFPSADLEHSVDTLIKKTNATGKVETGQFDATLSSVNLEHSINGLISKMYPELISGGDELLKRKRIENARRAYAAALALEPDTKGTSPAASRLIATFVSQGENWLQECRKWTESNVPDPKQRSHLDLAIGERFYRKRQFSKAVEALTDVAKHKTVVGQSAALMIALCLLGDGRRAEALKQLNAIAVDSVTNDLGARALFLSGWVFCQAQEHEKAESAFTRLAKEYPKSKFAPRAREINQRLKSHRKTE